MESSHISTTTNLNIPPNNSKFIEWNDKLETSAKNIGESAKGYKLMHITEAQKAHKIYNRLMILGMVLGPLASLTTGFHDSLAPDIKTTISVIGTVAGILSGVVVAIIKFGKYDEESRINKQAAARYTSIESNVRRQLSLYRNDRIPASTYMEWLELKYEELFLSAPLLPPRAYDEYYNVSKKLGLTVPNRYEATITINNEFNNSSIVDLNQISSTVNNTEHEINNSTVEMSDISSAVHTTEPKVKNNSLENNSRENTSPLPQLDHFSDRMLQYELRRLMQK